MRIGEQNRRTIGRKHRPQPGAGRHVRGVREARLELGAVELAKISDRALADMGQFVLGDGMCRFTCSHASLLACRKSLLTNPHQSFSGTGDFSLAPKC